MLTSNGWKANALWIFMAFVTWMFGKRVLYLFAFLTAKGFVLSQLIPFFSSLLSIIASVTVVWFTFGLSGVIWLADNKKYSHRSPSGWFGNTEKKCMTLLSAFIVLMAVVITPLGIYSAVESIKEGYREGSYSHPFACRVT